MPIEINAQMRRVINAVENRTGNLFVTGKAGTGKSTLLRHMVDHCGRNVVVLAPTGLAALNARGITIHSFFKLPIKPLIPGDRDIPKFGPENFRYEAFRNADLIIIDEISMVRADILDAVDHSLRINCGKDLPFAGKQVLLFGDPFQLEPIIKDAEERAFLEDFYESAFFFDSFAYRQGNFSKVELTKVYRQRDMNFIKILNKVRTGVMREEDLEILNEKCYRQLRITNLDDFAVCLCVSNRIATGINHEQMQKINRKKHVFVGRVERFFDTKNLPTPMELELKESAKMMILKNGNGYANGTIGIVEQIGEEGCLLRLPDGEEVEIRPHTWEQVIFKYNRRERRIVSEVVGTYTQLPLLPAWAITIHKSQGLTFNTVHLDFGQGTFAAGQAYVGLSRCTSLAGLSLARRLYPEDIKVHPRVLDFFGMAISQVEVDGQGSERSKKGLLLLQEQDW